MKLRSIIQCPHCGFKVTEKMSPNQPLHHYRCEACQYLMETNESECCVFCRYGSQVCPKKQQLQVQKTDQ